MVAGRFRDGFGTVSGRFRGFDFLRFSSIFFDFLRFSSIFFVFLRFSSIFFDFLRFSAIFFDFLRFSSIFFDFLRFSLIFFDFLRFSSIFFDFERRAGSGAAGDRNINGFQLKAFRKASILSAGPCRERNGKVSEAVSLIFFDFL